MRVLVLGGRGFIGRHVVAALIDAGRDVVVGSREPARPLRSRVYRARVPEIRGARLETLVEADAWAPLLAGIDVVVNCVGILRERPGERYDAIHHRAPAALAQACGARRLIHVSALGLERDVAHGFLTSKRDGERALRRVGRDVTVVRPSLLDGRGGFGAIWLRRLARLPIHVVPASATGRIAALDVEDLGIAIATLCERPFEAGFHEVDVGGLDERTLAEHLQALRRFHGSRAALTIRVPHAVARAAARICDVLHFSPFSLGHLELLGHDNLPKVNALASLIGRRPRPVGVEGPASADAGLPATS